MYPTDGDSKRDFDYKGKTYKAYFRSETKKGRGKCSICGRKKYFFSVEKVIGVKDYYGNEIDKDSDLEKELIEKLKRVVRRETICDHCEM
ncbi:MAG TPA: hypothetical protein P5323_00750 [Candidatus Moranbacteria bacterium]|nr:hypothetical protein [Candidatus Moranbacteria bacterium]HRY27643.1 hypothetical protein [Candidatus Moranbacteria bacterium]HSA08179.1 hypothetical protein [Candidatus Moranbacteria bacterium]